MTSIVIRVRGPTGTMASLTVERSIDIGALREIIGKALSLDSNEFDMLWGFPPKVCELPDDANLEGNLSSGENIRVQLSENRGKIVEAKAAAGKNKGRQQVGGASVAAAGAGAVTGKGSKSTTPKKQTLSGSSSSSSSSGFGARVATLSGPSSFSSPLSSSSTSSRQKRAAPGAIATLSSSSGIRSKRPRIRASKPKAAAAGSSSGGGGENDICDALLHAVSGGGSSMRDKTLRSVFRRAVELQYNSSLAVARLSAAFAGRYAMRPSENCRVLGTGESSKMDVTFPKTVGSRTAVPVSASFSQSSSSSSSSSSVAAATAAGMHTETVDLISAEAVKAVLALAIQDPSGHGREILKPTNMAKQSPRIFWSLIKAHGPDIAAALARMFPVIKDWSWLTERKKGLSEKAEENLRQQKEAASAAALRKEKRNTKKTTNTKTSSNDSSAGASSGGSTAGKKKKTEGSREVIILDGDDENKIDEVGIVTLLPSVDSIWSSLFAEPAAGLAPRRWLAAISTVVVLPASTISGSSSGSASGGEASQASSVLPPPLTAMAVASLDFDDNTLRHRINTAYQRQSLALVSASGDNNDHKEMSEEEEEGEGEENGVQTAAVTSLSVDIFESWVASAQSRIIESAMRILCAGSGRLYRALCKKGLGAPSALRVWRRSPEALLADLVVIDGALGEVKLPAVSTQRSVTATFSSSSASSSSSSSSSAAASSSSPASVERGKEGATQAEGEEGMQLSTAYVKWMAEIAEALSASTKTLWIDNFAPLETEEEEQEDEEEEDDEDKETRLTDEQAKVAAIAEGWTYARTDNEYVGRRVRLPDVLTDGFWEEGVIEAYLPPTGDEPEALWRVRSTAAAASGDLGANISSSDDLDEGDDVKVVSQPKKKQSLADSWREDIDEEQLLKALI